jgi:general secretion pathway protein A
VKAAPVNAADPPKPEPQANPGPEIFKKPPLPATDVPTAPSKTRLVDLLSAPSRGALSAAFSDLYARWGIQYPLGPSELGCKAAQARGFECLFLVGGWPRLRRYDVPAILEILLPAGTNKRVTLVRLSGETATLSIGGSEYSFPILEVDQVWDGSSIILWKPPFPPPYQLAPGAQGNGVVWVRSTLDSLDNRQPAAAGSDVYDDELRQRILSFQRNRALIQDGFVGNETLVRLTLALEGSSAPSLSKGTH